MSFESKNEQAKRYVQWRIEDAQARRDTCAKELLQVDGDITDEKGDTLNSEEQRRLINQALRKIESEQFEIERYKILVNGNPLILTCPRCYIDYGVQDDSLDFVNGLNGQVHCVVCKVLL